MNLLILNGSPKGGRSNTYRLTSAFAEGIQETVPVELRDRTVSKLDIKPCLGCFACWNKTPGKCCLSDDMAGVIADILWADLVIWSFPLYYFSVPGPLKNLIDRQLPVVLPFMSQDAASGGHSTRYDMSAKRHVVISTCGFYTAEGNYDGVNAMFDHICGKGEYTTIYCGQGELFRVKELSQRTDEYLSWVKQAGQEYAAGGIQGTTREKLSQLLYPRAVFEAMADASWGVEPDGEKTEESLAFTRQMAALYNKSAYSGKDIVLEMHYTDIQKRYQLILGEQGSTVITGDFRKATTIIETDYSLWKAIAAGEIRGEDALMQQKYRVKGDFDLMIHWDRYFGSQSETPKPAKKEKSTNMTWMLLPWMAFWIATAAVQVKAAALVGIAASVLTPLIFLKNRPVLSDRISAGCVGLLSILLLLDVSANLVLPLSYLSFGLMWTIGGLLPIPLTAHYSLNDYGGEGMLNNPLFIKTNRILTLCWGVLYLLMTLWTFVLLHLGMHWIGTVNSLLPAVMGVFTVWFQNWYPAHVARGK